LFLRDTRDRSHIPKQVAITVRIAIVEGSTDSPVAPAETRIAIPNTMPSYRHKLPGNQETGQIGRLPLEVLALRDE
jgi:hypothetical protein